MSDLSGAVSLRFLTGPEQGRRLSMPEGTSCTLGRGQDADLTLLDTEISRRHTTFERSSGELWVQDLGSKNGTFLGGRRLESGQRVSWRPRSAVVEVGYSRIALELPDMAAAETEAGSGLSREPQPYSEPSIGEPVAVTETTSTSGRGGPMVAPPQLGVAAVQAPATPQGRAPRLDRVVVGVVALALAVSLALVAAVLFDLS